ncbi:MAG: small, acid-soluble spore protein, alpha/beta type [Eubacterium sp.]
MSSSKNVVPEAKEALNRFKMEAAAEVGVQLHIKNSKSASLSRIPQAEKTEMLVFNHIKTAKIHKKADT